MKGILQRSFFPILILIVLVGSIALANEIMNKRHAEITNVIYLGPSDKVNKSISNTPVFDYKVTNLSATSLDDFWKDYPKSKKEPKASIEPTANSMDINISNIKKPDYRESVVVYFKEMPASVDDFASSYNVTPIFVKEDIKMAAFETSPRKEPGVTSQKTKEFIEQVSNDPLEIGRAHV